MRRSPKRWEGGREHPDPATASEIHGTAKWFNGQRGFGFFAAEEGSKDTSLHISVIDRAGIQVLPRWQRADELNRSRRNQNGARVHLNSGSRSPLVSDQLFLLIEA